MEHERLAKSIKEEIMFSEIIASAKRILSNSEHTVRRDRDIYDVFSKMMRLRAKASVVVSVIFMLAVTVSYAAPQYFEVNIVDGEKQIEVSSSRITVADLLAKSGIVVSKTDIVTPALDSYINYSQTVVIQRVRKVTVNSAGQTKEYLTTADTVGEFLNEKGYDINYHDIVSLPLDTELKSENELTVIKVIKRIEKVENPIPYNTKTIRDTSMSISYSEIQTPGVEGIDCETYEVILYDGVEQSRTLISTERTREPVDEVRVTGTRGGKVTEKGDNFSYSKVLTCNATAYDLSFQSCGKNPGHPAYGITASGTRAQYGTVAVDPKVIPLGTRMYIESADGSFVYGYCVAEDTGGAIKGNKVDLFFNTNSECMQFGRRSVNVYILD